MMIHTAILYIIFHEELNKDDEITIDRIAKSSLVVNSFHFIRYLGNLPMWIGKVESRALLRT